MKSVYQIHWSFKSIDYKFTKKKTFVLLFLALWIELRPLTIVRSLYLYEQNESDMTDDVTM